MPAWLTIMVSAEPAAPSAATNIDTSPTVSLPRAALKTAHQMPAPATIALSAASRL